jgi:hypothetical protein
MQLPHALVARRLAIVEAHRAAATSPPRFDKRACGVRETEMRAFRESNKRVRKLAIATPPAIMSSLVR